MNSLNVMQDQDNSMKGVCASARGGGGRFKFAVAKEHSSNGKELNALVALVVAKSMKINKRSKAKGTSELKMTMRQNILLLIPRYRRKK